MERPLALLDAPSNLGLRPPTEGSVPGTYKMPWALRDAGLLEAIRARDAGAVVPPRYESSWQPGDGVRNAEAIRRYSLKLAERVGALIDRGEFPVVVGGDCSILLGTMLALKHRGRYGLAFLDGHSDFRHPGNAEAVGAAAGEDLALVTGRGDERLTSLSAKGRLVRDEDVFVAGLREGDEYAGELAELGISALTSSAIALTGAVRVGREMLDHFAQAGVAGFWVHLDWDIVDGALMPAVDCPEADGLDFGQVEELLATLLASPLCAGVELTIYDPDLDEEGDIARAIVTCVARSLGASQAAAICGVGGAKQSGSTRAR